jgi:hypothetical protein
MLDFLIFLLGLLLLVKKVAQMERYHALRVVILTSILTCFAFYIFSVCGLDIGTGAYSDCTKADPDHFCLTEMVR